MMSIVTRKLREMNERFWPTKSTLNVTQPPSFYISNITFEPAVYRLALSISYLTNRSTGQGPHCSARRRPLWLKLGPRACARFAYKES